jgi:hypothetical protein
LPRIGPFQERLDTLLTENEGLPRRDRLRMTRIHDLLACFSNSGTAISVIPGQRFQ